MVGKKSNEPKRTIYKIEKCKVKEIIYLITINNFIISN